MVAWFGCRSRSIQRVTGRAWGEALLVALPRRPVVAATIALTAAVIACPSPAAAMPAGHAGHASMRVGHRSRSYGRVRSRPRGIVVQVVQTSSALSQLMKRMPNMRMKPGRARTAMVVNVRDNVRYQKILGFGATLT